MAVELVIARVQTSKDGTKHVIYCENHLRGSFINDVRRFLTIIDPPIPPNVQFLPYKRPIFLVILDPPLKSDIINE